jgi:hypothetical protein
MWRGECLINALTGQVGTGTKLPVADFSLKWDSSGGPFEL